MNFFERQNQVKKLSGRLVALFALAVVAIVLAVNVVVILVFGLLDKPAPQIAGTVIAVSVLTAAVIGLASLVRTATLKGGGGKVALELGGIYVAEDTTDAQLRRLRNVVEEIAIASGVPVPEVYVLEHEHGINAFAAGWSPADAAVAVTRGALDRLNRDELQGVIAHEFSHVINGDMRLNIKLIGLLFGILFLAVIGRGMLNAGIISGSGRRDNRDSNANALPLIGLALIAIGYLGVLIGRIIQSSVSRQREYLADASAVQFTRQTAGIAGALKKIGGLAEGSQLRSSRTEEVGHMLFGNGTKLTSLFATHPPLPKRILALEPGWNPAELDQLAQKWAAAPPSGLAEDAKLGFAADGEARTSALGTALPDHTAAAPLAPAQVVNAVATPTPAAYSQAGTLISQIPPDILARARRADTVAPLVFGLLMAADPEAQTSQYAILRDKVGAGVADASLAEARDLARLHPLTRLPLAELAFPILRLRHPEQQGEIVDTVYAMINADGRLTPFEYCLSRLMHRELYESHHLQPPWPSKRQKLGQARDAAATLLSVLADAGSADKTEAHAAFDAGVQELAPGQRWDYQPPAQGPVALEAFWPALDSLSPPDKEKLVKAMAAVIGHDGKATVTEVELLRTVCALLHLALPPLAGG